MILLLTQSVTTVTMQWARADNAGFSVNVTNLAGETGQNLAVIGPTLLGKWIRRTDTAVDDGGSSVAGSNTIGPVLAPALAAELVGAVPI